MSPSLAAVVERDLLSRHFLKANNVTKKQMREYLSDHVLEEGFRGLERGDGWQTKRPAAMDSSRVTLQCHDLVPALLPLLRRIVDDPESGWCQYILDTTLQLLFPQGEELHESRRMRLAKNIILQTIRTVINQSGHAVSGQPTHAVSGQPDHVPDQSGHASPNLQISFQPHLPSYAILGQDEIIQFLDPKEVERCNGRLEYDRLVRFWQRNYINEFMLLYGEKTGFNVLGHLNSVHRIAVNISRQLSLAGVPIDLALISGAAVGHDIGKFGCKDTEYQRIPYLHYYYTDLFFKTNDMPTIGHIATNHSTWDLELENLSAESLALIYADFRVKGIRDESGLERMKIYSLEDSFDIILNKLDNVDEAKRKRYERVYAKLKDFEEFMERLGVSTDPDDPVFRPAEKKYEPLLNSRESINRLKDLAIEHNISVMKIFNDEVEFGNLLEAARSEKQWKQVRAYINIFYEYSSYMTQKQKQMTMKFLYELLMHSEGDIRRLAAEVMGMFIANFDEEYRKELPNGVDMIGSERTAIELCDEYFRKIIFPDHKITEVHRRWIGYTLKIVINTLLDRVEEEEKSKYLELIVGFYKSNNGNIDDATTFILLDSMLYLPFDSCTERQQRILLDYCFGAVSRKSDEVQLGILRVLEHYVRSLQTVRNLQTGGAANLQRAGIPEDIREKIVGVVSAFPLKYTSSTFLRYRILSMLDYDPAELEQYRNALYGEGETTSDLFLENLKMGTPWVIKAVNIEYFLDRLRNGRREEKLHIATHLSNLLKVSEKVTVRHSAGNGLKYVTTLLTLDQRNEIVIELTKGLEIGEYQFSKYIPEYLGEIALFLHPNELDEMISRLERLLENRNERIVTVTLNTIGVLLTSYPSYKERFHEEANIYKKRRETLVGLLLRGLANYDPLVSQEAFHVIGKYIFGSDGLTLEEKNTIFRLLYKKMLVLITEREESRLEFFNNAAALNHIYRFISDYSITNGGFRYPECKKIAFFPGTFDPFSLSHKGIVQEIKKLGFEVYLSIDEFSWSKKTQPRRMRRKIITISTGNEGDVYVLPDEIQINLSNKKDLALLKSLFPGKDIHVVVGSDIIANASAYKKPPEPGSIHHFNHIVFLRSSMAEGTNEFNRDYSLLLGEVTELRLPTHLEDISSTRIRENIDLNRDISNLIDAVAQNYIYDNSLYLREPQYKSIILTKGIRIEKVAFTEDLIRELTRTLLNGRKGLAEIVAYLRRKDTMGILIRDGAKKDKIVGMSAFSTVETADLFREFMNQAVAAYLREAGIGKRVLIGGLYYDEDTNIRDPLQLLISETLFDCLKEDFTYAIYHPRGNKEISNRMVETLERQGFKRVEEAPKDDVIFTVDMKFPVVVIQNMESKIKYPFNQDENILKVLDQAHNNLQKTLSMMYPDTLILSVNQEIIHHKLIGMITEINQVPQEPQTPRVLGELMCVPFGQILNGIAVPNTVTKTLHTEKYFDPSIRKFTIKEYPNYSKLINQVRTIKSFDRGVILVDDLLHKGYRIRELDPIFKAEGVNIKKIVVGILSGRGKDLMTVQGRDVSSAYFIPNLRVWFAESAMYPYIGGDSVDRHERAGDSGQFNSINLILPYVLPTFMNDVPRSRVYDFSMECLKNAREILSALEEEYKELFQKNLTLKRIGEAIISPKFPDIGSCMAYDLNLAPSIFVQNDIERLIRLKDTSVFER
jgi:nicotinic acid mononucleotide adenylyltransferase